MRRERFREAAREGCRTFGRYATNQLGGNVNRRAGRLDLPRADSVYDQVSPYSLTAKLPSFVAERITKKN